MLCLVESVDEKNPADKISFVGLAVDCAQPIVPSCHDGDYRSYCMYTKIHIFDTNMFEYN